MQLQLLQAKTQTRKLSYKLLSSDSRSILARIWTGIKVYVTQSYYRIEIEI